jgi:hypothetical protein
MNKNISAIAASVMMCFSASALAVDAEIVGTVQSKCSVYTDTAGIYGNPTPNVLSTATADGGTPAIIRYDVAQADYYKAVITTPESFTSSPTLTDSLVWTGDVSVSSVSDPAMSAYDNAKRVFNNVTEVDLTVAGSTWFKASSTVNYGYNKSLPGGTFRAVVTAECIAK